MATENNKVVSIFKAFDEAKQLNAYCDEKMIFVGSTFTPKQKKAANQNAKKIASTAKSKIVNAWENLNAKSFNTLGSAICIRYDHKNLTDEHVIDFLSFAFDANGRLRDLAVLKTIKELADNPIYNQVSNDYNVFKNRFLHFFGSTDAPLAIDSRLSDKQRFILDALNFSYVTQAMETIAHNQFLKEHVIFTLPFNKLSEIVGDNYKNKNQHQLIQMAESFNKATSGKPLKFKNELSDAEDEYKNEVPEDDELEKNETAETVFSTIAAPDIGNFIKEIIPADRNNETERVRQLTIDFAAYFLQKNGYFMREYVQPFFDGKLDALKQKKLDVKNDEVDRAFYNQYEEAISYLKMNNEARISFSRNEILAILLKNSAAIAMNIFFDAQLKQQTQNLEQLRQQQRRVKEIIEKLEDCSTNCCVHETCSSAQNNPEFRAALSVFTKLSNQMGQVYDDLQQERLNHLTTTQKVVGGIGATAAVIGGGLLVAGGVGLIVVAGAAVVPVVVGVGVIAGIAAVVPSVAGHTLVGMAKLVKGTANTLFNTIPDRLVTGIGLKKVGEPLKMKHRLIGVTLEVLGGCSAVAVIGGGAVLAPVVGGSAAVGAAIGIVATAVAVSLPTLIGKIGSGLKSLFGKKASPTSPKDNSNDDQVLPVTSAPSTNSLQGKEHKEYQKFLRQRQKEKIKTGPRDRKDELNHSVNSEDAYLNESDVSDSPDIVVNPTVLDDNFRQKSQPHRDNAANADSLLNFGSFSKVETSSFKTAYEDYFDNGTYNDGTHGIENHSVSSPIVKIGNRK